MNFSELKFEEITPEDFAKEIILQRRLEQSVPESNHMICFFEKNPSRVQHEGAKRAFDSSFLQNETWLMPEFGW